MNEFAISTAWNCSRHNDAKSIADEIRAAGFNSIELNFKLTKDVVEGFLPLVKNNQIKIVSLHNFCPLPEGVNKANASPDYYSLASLDKNEKEKALSYTKQTIEFAKLLSSPCIVLHCGKVDIQDLSKRLIRMHLNGGKNSKEFIAIREDMIKQRQENAAPHFVSLLDSLNELNNFAKAKEIILGIENRCYFMEMPSFEEIGEILTRFKGSSIRYWHDVGHAQIFQELGFAQHQDFLDRYGDNIFGMHLHDVKGVNDHLAPGNGDFDFIILKPYIGKDVVKVIEPHGTETINDVMYGKKYLTEVFR